jgi:hypothetical protein
MFSRWLAALVISPCLSLATFVSKIILLENLGQGNFERMQKRLIHTIFIELCMVINKFGVIIPVPHHLKDNEKYGTLYRLMRRDFHYVKELASNERNQNRTIMIGKFLPENFSLLI